ncbi:hypothetical protein IHQ71_11625 [Rhizobium sp. TH2]|uniref:hypothetical protein n=1 Tax=Rhizobium sp. TH2 TaxID=2775403 RepID=UPI002156FBA1|nr:hypothetical protein [Rhizobium sp. TH2]UVC11162.1 hypothetical protein IHQ71_11625 [Rhizobium sp. TH2]
MRKTAIVFGVLAAFSAGSFAAADDVTIIKRDPDTTGGIVDKERQPKQKVIVRESSPDVVIKERRDPNLIIKGKVSID